MSDNTWYVAITEMMGRHYSFIAVGGENYQDYKKIAQKHGITILAERFDINDAQVDALTGLSEGKRAEKAPLYDLTTRLDATHGNAQEELDKLCASFQKK